MNAELDLGIRVVTGLLSIAWVLVIPYAKRISAKLDRFLELHQALDVRVTAIETRNKYADEMHKVVLDELKTIQGVATTVAQGIFELLKQKVTVG